MFSKIKNIIGDRKILLLLVGLTVLVLGAVIFFNIDKVSSEGHDLFLQRLDEMNFEGRRDEVIRELETYVQKRLTDRQKWDAYFMLGNINYDKSNFEEALRWYKQAEGIESVKHYRLAEGLALVYIALDNNQAAINYYRIAIDLARQDELSISQWYIPQFEARIVQLEKGEFSPGEPPIDTSNVPVAQ